MISPEPTLGSKDAAQDLRGKWIVELAELSAMKRSDVERTKAFMSRKIDHYRPSYGRRSQDFPRQCVFAGTTNADTYLGDETGNRRFWPVRVGAVDLAALARDREQLWAEAVAAFKAGERWWLTGEAEEGAGAEQESRRIVDPWQAEPLKWAEDGAKPVTIPECLEHLGVWLGRQDQTAANRVARIFKAAGWIKQQVRRDGTRAWVYAPPSEPGSVPSQVDPPSQVQAQPQTPQPVTQKPSENNAVTGVTGVTGKVLTHTRRERASETLSEPTCATRDTCDGPQIRPPDGPPETVVEDGYDGCSDEADAPDADDAEAIVEGETWHAR
jgi:Virulence-associated protein E